MSKSGVSKWGVSTRDDAAGQALLFASVFAVATCGLVYELIAGTLASYLLGDSVTQFSTIIGTYLFAMGVGSFLSGRIERDLLGTFVRVEILIGVVGGFSAALLFLLFARVSSFRIPLYGTVGVVGMLVGVEVPLLLRILHGRFAFKDLVARVFSFDYIGALFASLLFPLVLVPHLGLIRSGLLFGAINVGVALWLLFAMGAGIPRVRAHRVAAVLALAALGAGFVGAEGIQRSAEAAAFVDPVVYSETTPYQRIVVTASPRDVRLFLNNNLQFSSRDEYRYHEALVHPGLSAVAHPARVLLFGGGDGLAAREILKHPDVESITHVELDPAMVRLFADNPALARLNGGSYASPKVHVVTADAFTWLQAGQDTQYDFVVVDFPDPSNFSIGKLYSTAFFRALRRVVAPGGAVVVQSTSPLIARQAYWCVVATMEEAGFGTAPYHVYVPSFGEWGFVLAGVGAVPVPGTRYPEGLRFATPATTADMMRWPPDMDRVPVSVNRLDSQALVRYFDAEWSAYGVN